MNFKTLVFFSLQVQSTIDLHLDRCFFLLDKILQRQAPVAKATHQLGIKQRIGYALLNIRKLIKVPERERDYAYSLYFLCEMMCLCTNE